MNITTNGRLYTVRTELELSLLLRWLSEATDAA